MTDEQIIKILEWHIAADCCVECEAFENGCNEIILTQKVLDLINRQKAEIEELYSDKIIAETHEKAAKDLFVDCAKQREEAKAEIKRLKERISYLEESIDCSRKEYNRLLQKLQQAKSEAIKEFVERLKSKLQWDTEFENMLVFETDINNLVKEMTEVQE